MDKEILFETDQNDGKITYLSYQLENFNGIVSDLTKQLNSQDKMRGELAKARNGNDLSKVTIADFINNFLSSLDNVNHIYGASEIRRMSEEIMIEIVGYGPLDDLYHNVKKQDVFCNSYYNIQYQDDENKIHNTGIHFKDETHFESFINRLLDSVNEKMDVINPHVDVTLNDGTRLAATHKCITGFHTATFRFHPNVLYTFEQYVENGVIDQRMKNYFELCVELGITPVIYGATGSAKTSLLGAWMNYTYLKALRFVLISDQDEHFFLKKFPDANMVTFTSREKGKSIFTLEDCVKKSLRYRPQRIYFNEMRDGSIFTYLESVLTGHPGASGVHGETINKVINRLFSMLRQYDSTLDDNFCAERINSSIDMFIEMTSYKKSKLVRNVYLLEKMDGVEPKLKTIFSYDSASNSFIYTPEFTEKLEEKLKNSDMTKEEFLRRVG